MHASRNSIAALDGQRVALWGWGREGRSAWKAIRARLDGSGRTVMVVGVGHLVGADGLPIRESLFSQHQIGEHP